MIPIEKKPGRGCRRWPENRLSRLAVSVLLMGLLLPAGLYGQAAKKKKPKPPPRKMQLPVDSAAVKKRQTPKKKTVAADRRESRLQLPEVLIYGRDTSRRVAGRKITVSPDRPELVTPETLYEPLTSGDLRRGERETPAPPQQRKNRLAEFAAFGGQFDQFGFSANVWRQWARWDAKAAVALAQTYGQFANSRRRQGRAQADVGLRVSEKSRWRFRSAFRRRTQGLYGAVDPQTDREQTGLRFGVTGDFQPAGDVRLGLDVDFAFESLQDRPTATPKIDVDGFFFRFRGEAKKTFARGEISARAVTLSDRWNPSGAAEQNRDWQDYRIELAWQPVNWLSLQLAPGITVAGEDTLRRSRFSPEIGGMWTPHPSFAATVRFRRGWRYQPWEERLDRNPYLNLQSQNPALDVRWHGVLGATWAPNKRLVFHAEIEREEIDAFPFYMRDSLGTFALQTARVRLGRVSVGANLQFSQAFHLAATWNLLDDRVWRDGRFLSVLDVPYRPESELPVTLTYRPGKKLRVDAQLVWLGSRALDLLGASRLGSFIDVGGQVSFQPLRGVTLFVRAKNLLDENYMLWEGYRELGLHLLAGLQAKF